MDSLGGVFLPPWLVKDTFVWFALDNIEFLESTPCGMNTLHGTALAVYQSAAPDKLPIVMDRDGWSRKFHLCSLVIKKLLQFQISL